MNSERKILLSVLKFVTGTSEHLCRICFASTDIEGIFLEDTTSFDLNYYSDTVSYMDMLRDLGLTMENSLPFMLCMKCADMTTNSFLFLKMCQQSNNVWSDTLDRVNKTLDMCNNVGPNVQTAYLMVNSKENLIFTSRKSHSLKSKKTALSKIKLLMKSRKKYKKIKKQYSQVVCEECGERLPSNYHLVKHMSLHSDKRYPCPQCPKVFKSKPQLDGHKERIHYPKKVQCPKCSKMFTTERMLKYHDQLNHTAAICKLCFVQFPSKKILRQHLDNHELNKCPQCEKMFLNKQTFKSHLKICGDDEKLPQFFCDICNKGYARKNGLRTHLKTDHGFGEVYSCNWCGKRFDAISRLKNHVVKHTKEKNFHCEHCGGKFVTHASLIYHVRLHTGEKPFPCDMCSESFLSASRRAEHKKRKHIGPKQECEVCHSKFITSHQLKKHMERHKNPHSRLFVGENNVENNNSVQQKFCAFEY